METHVCDPASQPDRVSACFFRDLLVKRFRHTRTAFNPCGLACVPSESFRANVLLHTEHSNRFSPEEWFLVLANMLLISDHDFRTRVTSGRFFSRVTVSYRNVLELCKLRLYVFSIDDGSRQIYIFREKKKRVR